MERFNALTKNTCKVLDYGAALCIFLIMAVSMTNIILRVVFRSPLLGTVELVSIFSAIGIGLALAYSAYNNAQIAVSYFIDKMPRQWQNVIDMSTNLVCLAFWGTAVYYMALSGQDMAHNNLTTATVQIPLSPVIYIMTMGLVALCLVFVSKCSDLLSMKA